MLPGYNDTVECFLQDLACMVREPKGSPFQRRLDLMPVQSASSIIYRDCKCLAGVVNFNAAPFWLLPAFGYSLRFPSSCFCLECVVTSGRFG